MVWKRHPKPVMLMASLLALLALRGLAQVPQGKKPREPWPVPEKFKKVQNPVAATTESIGAGKLVFTKECLTCHGATGVGDGPQAKDLEVQVGNLRRDISPQTDGELYYKISAGRKPMPEFVKTLKPAERWHVINYIRTLREKWTAPEAFKVKENPVAADASSIDAGKTLYASKCASCHGARGTGDGEEAKKLANAAGDLRKDPVGRSDGELFWMLLEGHQTARDRLKELKAEERWHLVNYLRTLAEKPGGEDRS